MIEQIKDLYQLKGEEEIAIAKYFNPSPFDWRVLDPEEEVVFKKKKKDIKAKAATFDLRQFPFMLKDGDIIGVRFESENSDKLDDFYTE